MAATAEAPPQSLEKLLLEHADAGMQDREPKCCCGQPQCAFLAHNSAALEGLEQDLVSAAQIGQALLVRHESHMAEAEAQRLRMTATIEHLEADKIDLEAVNARTIEENRRLLDQLEELNGLVSASDAQVQSLTASLQSTRHELDRLAVLSHRTTVLEDQLSALETEQSDLQSKLATSEEGKRSAIQRWKHAEFTISQLQEQVDLIELEARQERHRHVEVFNRMEKRRAVERELEMAAGRLKGAAAMTNLSKQPNTTPGVVSHFVKDILQDNSHLQAGIMELRELLMGSNAEVESLREQLHLHRPLDEAEEPRLTLKDELTSAEPVPAMASPSPEGPPSLHVHHHYHAPNVTVRKTKKKRPSIVTNRYAASSGASTPISARPRDWYSGAASSISTILEQTSVSVPPINHQHRLSAQSTNTISSFALSSAPSSPRRASSVFDNIDSAFEASQPTTPESSVCSSPLMAPSDAVFRRVAPRSVSGPSTTTAKAVKPAPSISNEANLTGSADLVPAPPATSLLASHLQQSEATVSPFGPETIVEEVEQHAELAEPTESTIPDSPPAFIADRSHSHHPRLMRASSHDSLISVSGMDIHTLRARPSQQLLLGTSAFGSSSPRSGALVMPQSTGAVTTPETATGRPMYRGSARSKQSGGDLARELLAQARGGGGGARVSDGGAGPSLSRKVGGWVWSRWGMAPDSTVVSARQQSEKPFTRTFGVNQLGPIQGLLPPPETPSRVETEAVDEDALRESLMGLGA